MTDYISREVLENWLRTEMASLDSEEDREFVIARLRKEIPSVEVHKIVHGYWCERHFSENCTGFECSVCHTTWDAITSFCPFCGAKMDGEV